MTTLVSTTRVIRIEVRPTDTAGDPVASRLLREARALGFAVDSVRSARVYLLEGSLSDSDVERAVSGLLADPVAETAVVGAMETSPGETTLEVHPLAGVMDPTAASVRDALRELYGIEAEVSSGRRYDIVSGAAKTIAERLLANSVVSAIHEGAFHPGELPKGHGYELKVTRVPITDLDDAALEKLSRGAHLFLDLEEMRAIRDEYRTLGREPTDIELETLAQTWSEHCVHKTLKSRISYRHAGAEARGREDRIGWRGRPGHTVNDDGSVTIENLLKSTVAAATFELIEEGVDWTLSVFVDNAGIIGFDDEHAVCVKVETHNHPSALEPYGGAATGIGGCIRDIIGTGLAAKPIASTDVFCVATPDIDNVPAGCIHPRRILSEVVAGVRDYGNRMGIPTVNGAVWFDDRYVGNPLVYCGCVGVMPSDKIAGDPEPGDRIIALGGRTGRDGIHGATFSSAELTDTHADEFAHAVQIGNAIEEKRVLDAILRARDHVAGEGSGNRHRASGEDGDAGPLFNAITDCGAGGFSSAVGEMGEKLGAEVHLERAPLKYDGLSYTEIWISEAQERMVLAVPPRNLEALKRICAEEHVELADLGHFGTPSGAQGPELILNYGGTEVGRLPMSFLHDGIPTPIREAVWRGLGTGHSGLSGGGEGRGGDGAAEPTTREALLRLLAHPNIASKHEIIRQYDHEVQGNTVVKPLGGPLQRGPMDAAVIEPVPGSGRGIAIGCGLATNVGDPQRGGDPYEMALAAIDECVRNLVCVGADPERIAILDNFCWPSCRKPENLASLVRAAEGCYDGAKAYRTPFVSGKDSLNNQFTTEDGRTIEIPPTLLITGVGIVEDLERVVTMAAKRAGNTLAFVGRRPTTLRASHFGTLFGDRGELRTADLDADPRTAATIASLVAGGHVAAAHDVSDGGVLCAIAEMLIGSDGTLGASVDLSGLHDDPLVAAFGEGSGGYVLELDGAGLEAAERACGGALSVVGSLDGSGSLAVGGETVGVGALAEAWLGTVKV